MSSSFDLNFDNDSWYLQFCPLPLPISPLSLHFVIVSSSESTAIAAVTRKRNRNRLIIPVRWSSASCAHSFVSNFFLPPKPFRFLFLYRFIFASPDFLSISVLSMMLFLLVFFIFFVFFWRKWKNAGGIWIHSLSDTRYTTWTKKKKKEKYGIESCVHVIIFLLACLFLITNTVYPRTDHASACSWLRLSVRTVNNITALKPQLAVRNSSFHPVSQYLPGLISHPVLY